MPPNPEELLPARTVLVPLGTEPVTVATVRALRLTIAPCWDPARVEVLTACAVALLRHERLRRDPAAAALAFWLRRAHLKELAQSFPAESGGRRVPAGLVLHITPANVDTMFMYSWALSFLAGNANIVRLTTRASSLMRGLLEVLAAVFVRHREATQGNWFVSYEHDDAVTGAFSAICDQRIVWGGDETVRRLRAIPLNPHAGERSFASKRSLSVVDATAYQAATRDYRRQLAVKMAVDVLPFGQMACSSPHQVFWVGPASVAGEGIRAFEADLEAAVAARSEGHDLSAAVLRLNAAFAGAASGAANRVALGAHTASLEASQPAHAEQANPCGASLLFHAVCGTVTELAVLLRPDHQTITYFGLSAEDRNRLAGLAGVAGVDRLVPIGQALDFSPHWDGYALWTDLTRHVTVR